MQKRKKKDEEVRFFLRGTHAEFEKEYLFCSISFGKGKGALYLIRKEFVNDLVVGKIGTLPEVYSILRERFYKNDYNLREVEKVSSPSLLRYLSSQIILDEEKNLEEELGVVY